MSIETPAPERRQEILRKRRERLAAAHAETTGQGVADRVAVVQIGPEQVAIPVARLREVVPAPALSTLPGAPQWLRGIAQVRGELLSAIDVGPWLGLALGAEPASLVVLDAKDGPIGVLADRLVGFREIREEELTHDRDREDSLVRGVTRDLVAVLDVDRLLAGGRVVLDAA